MRLARFSAALVFSFAIASGATAATRTTSASLGTPQDLHGFLLRADEPSADTFTRTPSFAWQPVRGAVRYQFQLATTRSFSTSSLLYSTKTLLSPATSLPDVSLPWFTGSPYSLYAHVRGIAPNGATGPWSQAFGFNMRWSNLPTPLSAPPDLIRWTPVEGATSYEIWLLDPDPQKIVKAVTNVLDEREFYTFHPTKQFIGAIHYRIRAVRALYGLSDHRDEKNGMPITSYGPWSPVYTATNPAYVSKAKLTPVETISDTTSTAAIPAAHRLMPAFVWTGDTGLDGVAAALFRVYVATDKDCVNIVYRSPVVGGTSYAPRTTLPLVLPDQVAGIEAASTSWLSDGRQSHTVGADLHHYDANEELPPDTGTPITSGEDDSPTLSTAPTGPGASGPGVATLQIDAVDFPPPVDLWDTDWPQGRYYWTVVPVAAQAQSILVTSLTASAPSGATTVSIAGAAQLAIGDVITVGAGSPAPQPVSVLEIAGNNVAIAPALTNAHPVGETVTRAGGAVQYRDMELAQDACQSGRFLTFGKTSEPTLTRSNGVTPFASGLSPAGRLASATTSKPSFYGQPVVAWQPAVGANAYEVQWSAKRYPFKQAATPILTYGTSALLPLTPGTWWYRVRGINFALPPGARAMGWSDPVAVVVTKPKFAVVPTKR